MAESLITKERNQSLWIYTADCMPILIANKKTRNIAECHNGLKGLERVGSNKNNLIIAIGAFIQWEEFEIKIKILIN